MTLSGPTEPEAANGLKSRRRDWILLPGLALLTVCLMAVSAELLSRQFFPVTQGGFQNCFKTNDPTGDAAVRPNSVCWEQTAESTLKAEYRFNSRGHRAGGELNPKPPGTYRIVLIGSSLTQGLFVPREKTFAALLPEELSMETGRKIEVYNEATGGKFRGWTIPNAELCAAFRSGSGSSTGSDSLGDHSDRYYERRIEGQRGFSRCGGHSRGFAISDRFRQAPEFLEQNYRFNCERNVRRAIEISMGRHSNIHRAEASSDRERKSG